MNIVRVTRNWPVLSALLLGVIGCSDSGGGGEQCKTPDQVRQERLVTTPGLECTPVPTCPHSGGYPPHDLCADRSGNVAWDGVLVTNDQIPNLSDPPTGRAGEGCDVAVGARRYDALSWDSMQQHRRLWEV